MLSFSRSVGYALQALGCLESGSCRTRYVRNIAACSKVPPAYLAKLFRKLVEAGILNAARGPGGGTTLAREASQITLLEIIEVIDGPADKWACLLGLSDCCEGDLCPTYEFWTRTRREIEKELRKTTLADVIEFRRRHAAGKPRASKPKPSSS